MNIHKLLSKTEFLAAIRPLKQEKADKTFHVSDRVKLSFNETDQSFKLHEKFYTENGPQWTSATTATKRSVPTLGQRTYNNNTLYEHFKLAYAQAVDISQLYNGSISERAFFKRCDTKRHIKSQRAHNIATRHAQSLPFVK